MSMDANLSGSLSTTTSDGLRRHLLAGYSGKLTTSHGGLSFCFSIAFFSVSAIVCPIMVVRMRHTRSHSANRRSHHALKSPEMAVCKNCGAMHRPHHMCLACGFYNGRIVIDMKAKAEARAARMTAKREAIRAEAGLQAEAPATK